MDLRITPDVMWSRLLAQTKAQTARLGKLQEQASTGKKILRPSDDPLHLSSLLASKSLDQRFDAYLGNVGAAQSSLNQSVSALQNAGSLLAQARNIAIEGSQSTNSPTAREALAQQVDRLLESLIDVANTKMNGRYLFAGAAGVDQPFAVTYDSQGRPTAVSYQGENVRNSIPLGTQQNVATMYSGQDIFQAGQRGATMFTGATGAAPGSGTDNATAQGVLQVRHLATTYNPGSGIAPGTSSASGDTLLGSPGVHQLTVQDTSGTGAFGTISLNGGPAIAFTSADTDLQITSPTGEVVHVNAAAITPGFNGTVGLSASGTMSVDGGLSTTPITFAANQAVTNAQTGAVTNVNSSGIRRPGDEQLTYQGAFDAFQTLMALRDNLRNVHHLPETQQLEAISQTVAEFDLTHAAVLDALGEQSASLESMERLRNNLQDMQLSTREFIGGLEDADLSQIVIQLQSNENLLRLTLAASVQIMNPSLLDYIS